MTFAVGCSRKQPESLAQLREEFVFPQAGYHQHKGASLDTALDDVSETALNAQRQFYRQFRDRLTLAVQPERLAPEDRADYDVISDQISAALLELDEIQNYRHNPTVYVELIGSALFYPYVLEYAPKPDRYRHIIARLEKIPALLDQAKKNLLDSPEIWAKVAMEENAGSIDLVGSTLREGAPAELSADYKRAAEPALAAMRAFGDYLKTDLAKRQGDWRLGKEKYAKKFRCVLETDQTLDQVLAAAEAELKKVRKQMFDISLPLHAKMYPTHRDKVDLNLIVGETLGGFVAAPVLEPQLGAFYWLTPIPKTWPRQRIDSKLREYNFYGLKLLTIHEAMPGHYVQFEIANQVQPASRRVLRAVYGNGSYVEGWAVYATQMMLDEGYLEGSPELRLTFLKQQLRMIANAILDVRLQTMGMTDQQAMDLMTKQGFQENEEATAKLQRAKLSSCQLPTYFVGWSDWLRLREQYRKAKGAAFQLSEFHKQALAPAAVPLPSLARILTGQPLGQ
jgi:uncharacterized protein (DUF885 family)